MKEEKISIHPFEKLKIENYQSLKQINEHAYVKLSGMIPYEKKEEYIDLGQKRTWVHITAIAENSEYTLFYGIVESMEMQIVNKTCKMELILYSGTLLMDYHEKIRSFQDEKLTYGDLLNICGQGYENVSKIMNAGEDQKIGQFIMQYKETDWAFIKRLASMINTVVIPNCSVKGEKYYFGIPNRHETMEGDHVEYRTQCDIEEYWEKKGRGMDALPADSISYVWESREIYELGDCGRIGGKKLIVWKIETQMRGNILYHTYFMRIKSGLNVPMQYNSTVSGVSLFGRVLGVSKEKVQIQMFEDENKDKSGSRWFPYATVYSSPDGTGWYCMPNVGDRIRLYFPTENEMEAYTASAYHEEGAGLRENPKCKFWRNREGKEIQLSPEKVLLTNNNGTYIELSDAEGVKIVSRGPVALRADGALDICSYDSSIEFNAREKIILKQGDTKINLASDLSLSGAQIKL